MRGRRRRHGRLRKRRRRARSEGRGRGEGPGGRPVAHVSGWSGASGGVRGRPDPVCSCTLFFTFLAYMGRARSAQTPPYGLGR